MSKIIKNHGNFCMRDRSLLAAASWQRNKIQEYLQSEHIIPINKANVKVLQII